MKEGRIGFEPLDTLSRDQMCAFHNDSTPFIHRNTWQSPHYKITIGESFEDIMYGEAFKQPTLNDGNSQSNKSAIREASGD